LWDFGSAFLSENGIIEKNKILSSIAVKMRSIIKHLNCKYKNTCLTILLALVLIGCSHSKALNNPENMSGKTGNPALNSAAIGQADNPAAFREIIDANTPVEKVAGNFEFTEGPLWHPDGFLLFSDVPGNTIYQWQPNNPVEVFRRPSGNANGNTFDRLGRLITAEHSNRRISRTEKDGKVITLVEKYQGKRLNSPNDLVVKSDGSIYFTDPPYGIKSAQQELDFSGVYRLDTEGNLTLLFSDFVRPNGIAFSPDETKLYVNDSEAGQIRVFDIKPDGTLANGRIFAEQKNPNQPGVPDGMKVDIKGNVYSTGPGGVWVFSPEGNLLGIIQLPEVPANLAWGDRDYQTLYLTARNSLYRVRLKIPGVRVITSGE
jgi:sugar lactone lactonase YvrE